MNHKLSKILCTLVVLALLCVVVYAAVNPSSVTIGNNGSRLVAKIENITNPTYQWQISNEENGTYADIPEASDWFYDITAADEGKFIRAVVNGFQSEPVGPLGKLVVFDLAKGSITFNASGYSGKNTSDETVSGAHVSSNIYVVRQSNRATFTTNNITFASTVSFVDAPFDITLDGVNMGDTPTNHNQGPGVSGSNTPSNGYIGIPAYYIEDEVGYQTVKNVTLRLKDENIVRHIRYYNGSDTNNPQTVKSSLKITDINGDGATNGGSLYMPVKVAPEDIDAFVQSKTNYNHWNAAIGGLDSNSLVQNLTIAGGKIQVLTTLGDNCTAIGAGGNGYCQMTISGGDITAHCNGTGAAIGGGIGWNSAGGRSDITISGGKIYAKNHGKIYVYATRDAEGKVTKTTLTDENGEYNEVVGGVAIGSGSSFISSGTEGEVTIIGGEVEAYGTFGNGIGGGNSSSGVGGEATITISGGKVKANYIGGGDSKKGAGGEATVNVSGSADVDLTGGIGGGDSENGHGGDATITVTGGSLNCAGTIGAGNGGTAGNGGEATITVEKGTLTAASIGGGKGSVGGHGGAAKIIISGGSIETGSIGGGATDNPTGKLGYATADISGGDISGQFLMAAGGTQHCYFKMTGGKLHNVNTGDTSKYQYVEANGAAVYMDDPDGIVEISGGTIENCVADNGGAIYMTNGSVTISGDAVITNCKAKQNGGVVYMGGGTLEVQGGTIYGNSAVDGGAMYLANGEMHVVGGSVSDNIASGSGGGAFVNGGIVSVHGGSISTNKAYGNGGGISVNNGSYQMDGGEVVGNQSLNGSGGGIYVSTEGSDVAVDVLSGSVSNNIAKVNGGALAVFGPKDGTENINVTIGVNVAHYDGDNKIECVHKIDCEHTENGSADCPAVNNNTAGNSGGAVYVTGSKKTVLNIFCLTETGSTADGDKGQSNFMKVDGGTVLISTSDAYNEATQSSTHGHSEIKSTIYITGGDVDLWGDMANPRVEGMITVDILDPVNDEFDDHRAVNGFFKLLYYENFIYPGADKPSGQYKEIEVPLGSESTILPNIYHHPGYTIVGWNTDPKGQDDFEQKDNPASDKGWYRVNQSYKFDGNPIGDLIIYAIWEANGYTVIFDRNAPSGTGNMGVQELTYDTPEKLNKNQFKRTGYIFAGWNREKDGSGETFADQQEVVNLVSKEGDVVTLYAQWEVCTHTDTHTYTYSVVNDGKTLKRECSCEGYSETAALSASNTVYDKISHPASVTYSSSWMPEVIHTKDGVAVTEQINAGTYVASVTAGGKMASVTYVIDKAQQDAPPKPTYETELQGEFSVMKIRPVAQSPLVGTDDTYTSYAEYMIVYYVGETRHETLWTKGEELAGGFAASFNLDIALTNYYIYARYSGCDNYYPSPATMADSSYFFAGDVEIRVVCGAGLTYTLDKAGEAVDVTEQGVTVGLTLDSGHYFPDGFVVSVEALDKTWQPHESASTLSLTITDKANGKDCSLQGIPTNSIIVVTISDAKKIPTMDVQITEKEVFGTVAGTEANISRDSAYTIAFTVHDYDTAVYQDLTLMFFDELSEKVAIPKKTSIIMLDQKNGVYYSWVAASSDATEVELHAFKRMGSNPNADENAYSEVSGELSLQFIIDFSASEAGMPGDQIETKLSAAKRNNPTTAPDLHGGANTLLNAEGAFDLTVSGEELVNTFDFEYALSTGVTSKWDNRRMALVLSPVGSIPADAYMSFTDGTNMGTAYPNSHGAFVLPLSAPSTSTVTVTLVSQVFPASETTYLFTAEWIMADSIASEGPGNGLLLEQIADISFVSKASTKPSIKIEANSQLYSSDQRVAAKVSWANIPVSSKMTVTLMKKAETGGYSSTAWTYNVPFDTAVGMVHEFAVPLNVYENGSYCLVVTVMNGLIRIAEAEFYFLIE